MTQLVASLKWSRLLTGAFQLKRPEIQNVKNLLIYPRLNNNYVVEAYFSERFRIVKTLVILYLENEKLGNINNSRAPII